jgi:hypothetical protein
MLSLLVAAAVLMTPPVPTTVNDQLLGTVEEFAFRGPGKVCFGEASISIEVGETSYLEYSGIHSLRILVVGQKDTLQFTMGDSWAKPKGMQRLLMLHKDFKVTKVGNKTEFKYLISAKTEFSDRRFKPRIWVDGTGLRGTSSDKRVFLNLSLSEPPHHGCGITYDYGWGVLMDGDPVVIRQVEESK